MSIPCAQATLYTVGRNIWNVVKSNIVAFAGVKGYYDVAYCDARLAEIKAAEDLPDNQARGTDSEILKLQLVGLAATCREEWQWLSLVPTGLKIRNGNGVEVKVVVKT